MTVWTPDITTTPRWLAFAQPLISWYQLRRDLADLRSDLEREERRPGPGVAAQDSLEPCPAC